MDRRINATGVQFDTTEWTDKYVFIKSLHQIVINDGQNGQSPNQKVMVF